MPPVDVVCVDDSSSMEGYVCPYDLGRLLSSSGGWLFAIAAGTWFLTNSLVLVFLLDTLPMSRSPCRGWRTTLVTFSVVARQISG